MERNETTAAPFTKAVGQRVMDGDFAGTITRVCEWSNSMVEVRLARGTVCVDFHELRPLPASPLNMGR